MSRIDQLRKAQTTWRDKQRASVGQDPLDRTPVSPQFCQPCRWAVERCLRSQGPCQEVGAPGKACRVKHIDSGLRPRPCSYYRAPCARRRCDCAFYPHFTQPCQHCEEPTPHTHLYYVCNTGNGVFESKRRVSRLTHTLRTIVCEACLAHMTSDAVSASAKTLGTITRMMMYGGRRAQSPEVRKAKAREYQKKYRAHKKEEATSGEV